jgi:hypothetical protein
LLELGLAASHLLCDAHIGSELIVAHGARIWRLPVRALEVCGEVRNR